MDAGGRTASLGSAVWPMPLFFSSGTSEVPAPLPDESLKVGRCDADRMQHPNVPKLPLGAQPVHRRGADAELRGDLTNGQERRRPPAW